MSLTATLMVSLAVIGGGGAAQAIQPAGKVTVALSIFSAPGDTAVQDTLTLYVSARAAKGRGPQGRVHVWIPQGLTFVTGDTMFITSIASGVPPHRFTVRVDQPGTYELRSLMEVDTAPGERDLSEVSLDVLVEGRMLRPQSNVIHRLETTRKGQRYRMAGPLLVPMAEDEAFDNVEFQRSGKRAQVTHAPSAACAPCTAAETVQFVVVVDKAGKVVEADPESNSAPAAVEAARSVLSDWRFEPARLRGHGVADWIRVRVPVTPRR